MKLRCWIFGHKEGLPEIQNSDVDIFIPGGAQEQANLKTLTVRCKTCGQTLGLVPLGFNR
jgi:hypothetical protein